MIKNKRPKDMYIQNIDLSWNIRASLAERVESVKHTLFGRGIKSRRIRYSLLFDSKLDAQNAYNYLENYLPSSKLSFVIKSRVIR